MLVGLAGELDESGLQRIDGEVEVLEALVVVAVRLGEPKGRELMRRAQVLFPNRHSDLPPRPCLLQCLCCVRLVHGARERVLLGEGEGVHVERQLGEEFQVELALHPPGVGHGHQPVALARLQLKLLAHLLRGVEAGGHHAVRLAQLASRVQQPVEADSLVFHWLHFRPPLRLCNLERRRLRRVVPVLVNTPYLRLGCFCLRLLQRREVLVEEGVHHRPAPCIIARTAPERH
mmetsp:Transcript_49960/g.117029  ORF Transcript_49960/g.117029 Transcript_49960/m.117029 type:complete len:232 (-) Transcript_49960:2235-2930(-)